MCLKIAVGKSCLYSSFTCLKYSFGTMFIEKMIWYNCMLCILEMWIQHKQEIS